MDPERYQKIGQLFQNALGMEPARRADFLNEVCGGDQELRLEVESLIHSHEQATSFIETPALHLAAASIAEERAQSFIGRIIGSYEILSLLGAGGMGRSIERSTQSSSAKWPSRFCRRT